MCVWRACLINYISSYLAVPLLRNTLSRPRFLADTIVTPALMPKCSEIACTTQGDGDSYTLRIIRNDKVQWKPMMGIGYLSCLWPIVSCDMHSANTIRRHALNIIYIAFLAVGSRGATDSLARERKAASAMLWKGSGAVRRRKWNFRQKLDHLSIQAVCHNIRIGE